MNRIKLTFFLFLLTLRCSAQLPSPANPQPIKGSFYVSIDDVCTIFVNGEQKYQTRNGDSRSPELELKVGDRVVVQLQNNTDGRHFIFLFASTDGKSVLSFKHRDFKIVPDLGVTDFTPEQYQSWSKYAKEEKQSKAAKLPVKSASEFIWGDLDKTILAGLVTPQMIGQRSK